MAGFAGFDHLNWYVGNGLQASLYFCHAFGMERVAFRGLETGFREGAASHVVRRGNITFVLTSAVAPDEVSEGALGKQVNDHVKRHGDGVKDVAFRVKDARAIYAKAIKRGAKPVREPYELRDENGTVVLAAVATYGETIHTFVQRQDYRGAFLPGYVALPPSATPAVAIKDFPRLSLIDHVVGNQPYHQMNPIADWYRDKLEFQRYWTPDDKITHTDISGFRSIVVADDLASIKMPINEPADGNYKSQIQEYVEYYGGPGVQHIALLTDDCIDSVAKLKARGVAFLEVPPGYYEFVEDRIRACPDAKMQASLRGLDWKRIKDLHIMVDFNETGYLLQIFSRPVTDRPTVFIEIIQRVGAEGFGAGNFQKLYASVEIAQKKRGNL